MIIDLADARGFSLPSLAAVYLLVWACGTGPSKEERAIVMKWLSCEECIENELEAVRAGGDDLVPLLAEALKGPPSDAIANVERQLQAAHTQLVTRGPPPPLARDPYVSHYLRNYKALYQSRAITGLAAIGTRKAMSELEDARDRPDSRVLAYQYRSDVKEELNRAVEGRWSSMSAGLLRTCGIRSDKTSYCWGDNDQGQLGDGTNTDRLKPTLIDKPDGAADDFRFMSIATGVSGQHTCGVSADKLAYCWGSNARGELGDLTTDNRAAPTPVAGALSFVGVTVGENHACGWTPEYQGYCWGANDRGQLGDGTTTGQLQPVRVAANLGPKTIRAGATHTCADSLNDVLHCWGSNSDGQFGDGSTTGRTSPVQAIGAERVKALSVGAAHTCLLTRATGSIPEGAAYCAGNNADGQLGDGSTTARSQLTKVVGGPLFLAISAGENHTCGISTNSRIMFCWGDNQFGQLGSGTTVDRTIPDSVSGGRAFLSVSAGAGHTCGVTTDGEAYCWGRNANGQLGDTTTTNRLTPVKVVKPEQ